MALKSYTVEIHLTSVIKIEENAQSTLASIKSRVKDAIDLVDARDFSVSIRENMEYGDRKLGYALEKKAMFDE